MLTNGSTTVDTLFYVPNLVVVPVLFDDPDEGYTEYILSLVPNPEPVGKGTIPDMILQMEGRARLWGLLLPRIIMGEYEEELLAQFDDDAAVHAIRDSDRPEYLESVAEMGDLPRRLRWAAKAKQCRLLFEAGGSLYIGMWENAHRYRQTVPILRYLGQNRYIVGGPDNHKRFKAKDHVAAIMWAKTEWYAEQHKAEIAEIKKLARQTVAREYRFMGDVLGAVLEKDEVIYDEDGTRVAWKNGRVHGRFGVMAPEWCYIMTCAPATAGMVLVLAQQEAKKIESAYARLQLNLSGRVHEYFDLLLEDDGRLVCDWGEWRPSQKREGVGGVYRHGSDRPVFLVSWGENQGVLEAQVLTVPTRRGEQPKPLLSSRAPRSWDLTPMDVVAWGFHSGVQMQVRKERQAQRTASQAD